MTRLVFYPILEVEASNDEDMYGGWLDKSLNRYG